MNYPLRTCAAFFAGSCLAFDASALSMKALKTHVVQFHESGVTLAAADRQAVATFAESLREADWCPLVVVIGEAKFLIDKHDTKTMAEARAAYVTNLLKRNGVPAQVLFFFVQPSPPPYLHRLRLKLWVPHQAPGASTPGQRKAFVLPRPNSNRTPAPRRSFASA